MVSRVGWRFRYALLVAAMWLGANARVAVMFGVIVGGVQWFVCVVCLGAICAMMMLRIKGAALKSKGSWTLEDARQGDVYFDGLHDCTWVVADHFTVIE